MIMKKNRKFVIVMTRTYSGGNLGLRLLGRFLQSKGHSVEIYPYNFEELTHPNSLFSLLKMRMRNFIKTKVKQCLMFVGLKENPFCSLQWYHEKILPFVSKNTIVVYSEGVYGNPLHAKNVVRWFLFHNRFPNDPNAYGKDELTFSFREHFNDYNLNPTCRLLKVNHFNSELYKQTNFEKREGVCYIIRKGKNRTDLPKTFDGPIIDNLPEKEKVAVFNRCKYCYDYDTQTFYNTIACVCGCIPIVMMEPGKTKADYLGKGDFDYGKAYGNTPKEIEYAIRTRPDRLKLLDYTEKNERNVDFFIQEIEKRFGSN